MTKYFSFIRGNVDATWQKNTHTSIYIYTVFSAIVRQKQLSKKIYLKILRDIEGRCQLLPNCSFYQSKIKVVDATSH